MIPRSRKRVYKGCRDALPLCKTWYEKYSESHKKCCATTAAFTPTRLIDVGDDQPRLCLTSEVEAEAKYATLSHY
jgi:hypothetical protein